jgi:hypothetical protein
MEQANLKPDP